MSDSHQNGTRLTALSNYLHHLDTPQVHDLLNASRVFKSLLGDMSYDERKKAYLLLRHEWVARIFRDVFTDHKPGGIFLMPAVRRRNGAFTVDVERHGKPHCFANESDAQATLCAVLDALVEKEKAEGSYYCKARAQGIEAQRNRLYSPTWACITDAAKLFAVGETEPEEK